MGTYCLVMNVRKSNLEALLNLAENLLVILAADERNGETLGTETTSTANTVKVGTSIARQIVVDGQVDTLDIDTTTKNVSSNTDTLLELLELLVAADTKIVLVLV